MTIRYVADIGSNHNQDLKRTFKLIDAAKDAGCWGVKFQLFTFDTLLYNPPVEKKAELYKCELPPSFLPDIEEYCKDKKIMLGCTPFYDKAVPVLAHHIDFFKISSFDLLRLDLIRRCARTGKQVLISTGMSTMEEINAAIGACNEEDNDDIVLFHCRSDYPASHHNCELYKIKLLKREFEGTKIGWSDHTVEDGVIYQSIAEGAEYVEFHIDLPDMQGYESKHGHCWNPDKIKQVIHNTNIGKIARGPSMKMITEQDRDQRADPDDGMRPLKRARQ